MSPLLANVLLDEVDKELERRGHRFVRYVDDCNIYVRSQKAGERVLNSMRKEYARLHLKVNEAKSATAVVFGRRSLGYCLRRWRNHGIKLSVSKQALSTFKRKVKAITRRVGGKGMKPVVEQLRKVIPGWRNYFSLAQATTMFQGLDSWIRRRLRALQLKQ